MNLLGCKMAHSSFPIPPPPNTILLFQFSLYSSLPPVTHPLTLHIPSRSLTLILPFIHSNPTQGIPLKRVRVVVYENSTCKDLMQDIQVLWRKVGLKFKYGKSVIAAHRTFKELGIHNNSEIVVSTTNRGQRTEGID